MKVFICYTCEDGFMGAQNCWVAKVVDSEEKAKAWSEEPDEAWITRSYKEHEVQ